MTKDFKEWRDQYTLSTIQADHETIVHAAFDAGYDAASVGLSLSYLADRNFCERCGKRRGGDVNYIHTCTPPHQLGYPDTLDVMSTLRPRTFDDYGNKLPSCPPCNNHCDQGRNCPANKQ